MRKLSAILLISLFAFSQYARQLNYLECKFSNTFKTGPAKCDCEKKAGFDKEDTSKVPLSKAHTHIHLDELFAAAKGFSVNTSFKIVSLKPILSDTDDECEGNYPQPWQPPNT